MTHRNAQRLRRSTAGTLATIALATSPAAASPAIDPVHHDSVPPAAEAVDASTGGFVWGSALIGAGAATAVCLLTGAGLTTASRRHHREPGAPTASAA
jgi:hypothetical protein